MAGRILAGLFVVGHELAAAVDLDGGEGVGQIGLDGGQEAFGVMGRGTGVGSGDELFADGRDGLELLEVSAVAVQGQVVDLHQFPGSLGALVVSPALGVAVEASAALDLEAPATEGAGLDAAQAHALGEDAPEGGLAELVAFAGEHDAQSALAHEGEPGPHRPDAAFLAAAPPGAPWRGRRLRLASPRTPWVL